MMLIVAKVWSIVCVRWAVVAVAAMLLSACVDTRLTTLARHSPADDLDSTIDTIVNDKSTWVDPVNAF